MKLKVTKKDNTTEDFDFNKILIAVRKSAERIGKPLSETAEHRLKFEVMPLIHRDVITVGRLHEVVEIALSKVDSEVADSYRGFRNYIKDLSVMMETVVDGVNKSMDQRDRSNSNMNSLLFSSRRTNASNILLTEMFEKFFLDEKERQATRDGFFYIHDKSNRLIGTHNCCVVKLEDIMDGGFHINGYFCKEPKDISNAVGIAGDIIVACASAQYGGFSCAELDTTLAKYCEKSVDIWVEKLMKITKSQNSTNIIINAVEIVKEELENALQGLEFQLNTRESSRGDFPFTTFTFGKDTSFWGRAVSETILKIRMKGHGKDVKQTAVFPKLVMILREDKANDDLFDLAVRCSSKCLYPDYIPEKKASPIN